MSQEVFCVGHMKHIDLWHISKAVSAVCLRGRLGPVFPWKAVKVTDWLRPSPCSPKGLLWCHGTGTSLASVATQSYWIISNDAQFIQDGQSGKNNVAKEGNNSQLPVELPSIDVDCDKEEDDGQQ